MHTGNNDANSSVPIVLHFTSATAFESNFCIDAAKDFCAA